MMIVAILDGRPYQTSLFLDNIHKSFLIHRIIINRNLYTANFGVSWFQKRLKSIYLCTYV